MRGAGLTHGGFYKHFGDKNELLMESLAEGFRETSNRLADAAEQSDPAAAWKAIVRTYLSPEHCDNPEIGCPVAALAPELAQADEMKPGILQELMIGAIALARILPDLKARAAVQTNARDLLLRSF